MEKSKFVAIPQIPGLQNSRTPAKSPVDLPTLSRTPDTASTNSPLPEVSPQGPTQPHPDREESPQSLQVKYGVYAKPFIPDYLRNINRYPGQVVRTEPIHQVNFHAYKATFAASSFSPNKREQPDERQDYGHNATQTVHAPYLVNVQPDVHKYQKHFMYLYTVEHVAQQAINDDFALYKVPIYRAAFGDGRQLYALVFPGVSFFHSDLPRLMGSPTTD